MSLRAGVAVKDISPQSPMFLAGYPHVPRISTGIHDPLLASVLCLRNDTDCLLMMAVDILFISTATAREARQLISHKTGIAEANIFISCTHTHSGPLTVDYLSWRGDPCVPPTDEKYLAFLVDNLVAASIVAAETPHHVEIAWVSVDARGVGSNRLSPDGVTDTEAGVLAVRKIGGELLALSTIYGMHPTVLHEDSTLVSGDFPAYTRLHLRENFGDSLVVLYNNAPCGNQSPRYAVKSQTFAEAERLGRMLGERIASAIENLRDDDFSSDAVLASGIDNIITVPRLMPTVAKAKWLLQ